MDVKYIDINCDLGEGMSNDAALMPLISSCSIACGGHFGNKETIRSAIRLAKLHKVKVGAHPSYPDKENFGRTQLFLSDSELAESLTSQLLMFLMVCFEEGVKPHHIKLHGALYNVAARDEKTAELIVQVIRKLNVSIPIYAPNNSILARLISETNRVIPEAFIDRRYQEDGNLMPRTAPNALIESPEFAWKQLKQLYFDQEITLPSNQTIPVIAETFCLHGDAENSLEIAQFISEELTKHELILAKNE